jgi:3-oxoacyl-[acyl-carrier protein] reductase
MTFDFSGKRVLLAGNVDAGLAGVGKTLQENGAHLIATEDAAAWGELPHETITLDIENPGALGEIDILVINAGWRQVARFLDQTPEDWDAAIFTNFETPIFLAQAVAKGMITRARGGRIIFLIGVEGLMPFTGTAAAGVSLTMLLGIMKMIAVDLAPYGITVNLIAEGWTDASVSALDADVQRHIVQGIPQGKPGTADDVGAAAAFLASDMAAYLTGIVIPVDGGYLLTGSAGQSMFKA